MKANNLTISVPADCQLDCPYCISKMTPNPAININLFLRNLTKARELARIANVTSVLVTSKGEPLNANKKILKHVAFIFKTFPLELQTNGIELMNYHHDIEMISWLYENYFNTIAISITGSLDSYIMPISQLRKQGLNVRLTVVLNDNMKETHKLIEFCQQNDVRQLTLRHATIPENRISTIKSVATEQWIKDNTKYPNYNLIEFIKSHAFIRTLSFNNKETPYVPIYNVDGIDVTIIDYCVQEEHGEEDIRSLIYHQDGHMYTSWSNLDSFLF